MNCIHQRIIYALLLIFPYCEGLGISTTVSAMTTTSDCPMFYYHDHGTKNCEFCYDICFHAEVWKTVSQCEALCPEYIQKLRDETAKQRQAQDDSQDIKVPKTEAEGSAKTGLPQAAEIIGVAASPLLLLLLLGLLIKKRKAIVGWLGRREPMAGGGDLDPEAVPFQPVPDNTSGDPKTPMTVSEEGQLGPDRLVTSTSGFTRNDSTTPKTFHLPEMALPESRL